MRYLPAVFASQVSSRQASQSIQAYSTTVSKNRRRRDEVEAGQAFELNSREETEDNGEEAKLWSRSRSKIAPSPNGNRETAEEATPWCRQTGSTECAAVKTNDMLPRTGDGIIKVKQETSVSYGS